MKTAKVKRGIRYFAFSLGVILIIVLIYTLIPTVRNPSPDFQTELTYGEPLPAPVADLLTPKEKPARTRALLVLENEKIVYEYGPTDKIMNIASIRKAIMSVLYGIAVHKGQVDLNKSLATLGIDELTPLTQQEKTATIRDLLMGKSGIYLPAQGEHDNQITQRPKRESHLPGTYFFANNFDANALGTIFIQETGMSIGKFMEEYLAKPLGMQDFSEDNVVMGGPWFWPKKKSMHQQYYLYMSTRDLARIGAMIANDGRWGKQQILPESWVKESTRSYSNLKESPIPYGRYDGFGYQWWLSSDSNSIWADGYGGRFLIISPDKKLSIVEQNFTGNSLLSTGLWLKNRNQNTGLGNLIEAHEVLIRN
ncbi:MAG: serine hydrolase [Bacteroidota bacterium]